MCFRDIGIDSFLLKCSKILFGISEPAPKKLGLAAEAGLAPVEFAEGCNVISKVGPWTVCDEVNGMSDVSFETGTVLEVNQQRAARSKQNK